MSIKTTSSTDWVYLDKFYSLGSSPIKTICSQSSQDSAIIQFREGLKFPPNRILRPWQCINHTVNPYTEVWFKSETGRSVTVECNFGRCDIESVNIPSAAEDQDLNLYTDDDVPPDVKAKIELILEAKKVAILQKRIPTVKGRILSDQVVKLLREIESNLANKGMAFQGQLGLDTIQRALIANCRTNPGELEGPDNPTYEGDITGPISTWIEHFNIDQSDIEINNIAGGSVKVIFQERIWSSWDDVSPNNQTADAGGSVKAYREVDSNIYDGDHRLKIECGQNVKYHLKFQSKDR